MIFTEKRGEDSVVYKDFPKEVKDQGRALRVTQLSQNVARHLIESRDSYFYECLRDMSISARTNSLNVRHFVDELSKRWESVAVPANGFRSEDADLPPDDSFRHEVTERTINHLLDFIYRGVPDSSFRERGLPETQEEADKTNEMVSLIGAHIASLRARVEKNWGFKRREIGKALDQWLIGLVMRYREEGKNDPRLEDKKEEVLGNLASLIMFLYSFGGEALLEQLEREAKMRENGDVDKETLDGFFTEKLFKHFAKTFIAGDNLDEVFGNREIKRLDRKGIEFSLAPEIESTGNVATGDKNYNTFVECLQEMPEYVPNEGGSGSNLRRSMSMKLSALCLCEYKGNFEDLTEDNVPEISRERVGDVKNKLRRLLEIAIENNVFIRIDMEQFFYKDVTFRIFRELLEENPVYADHLGVVFQAYQKESVKDAEEMVKWARNYHEKTGGKNGGKRVNLRLVKGAYVERTRQKKDPLYARKGLHKNLKRTWYGEERAAWAERYREDPIADSKETTQRQYTEIMRLFEMNTDVLDVSYGLHNENHLAQIIQTWMNHGQIPSERKWETLLGMYDWGKYAMAGVVGERVYAAYERLGRILAYMYRRFEELDKNKDFPATSYIPGGVENVEEVEEAA